MKITGSLALALFLIPAFGALTGAAELKIGVVDAQRVLDSSKEGKRVKASMEEFVKSRQKIIDLEEDELKKAEEELSRQSSVLSAEARRVKQDEFQKKLIEYQRRAAELNKEVQGKRHDILRGFNERVEAAVKEIAEKEGYTLVFDRNSDGGAVVYAKESLDLTPRVIELVDRSPRP